MGLGQSISGGRNGCSAYAKKYQRSFRKHVFTLLKLGYDLLDTSQLIDEEEPAITSDLAEAMNTIMRQPNHPQWIYNLAVHDDPPLNTTSRRGKARPRADLTIEQTGDPVRWEFTFEAKRFYKNSGITKYLGPDGLGMFLSGIYAPKSQEVGMLGYVQERDTTHWQTKLFQTMQENTPQIETLADELSGFSTRHQRNNGSAFTAYHSLLLFQ